MSKNSGALPLGGVLVDGTAVDVDMSQFTFPCMVAVDPDTSGGDTVTVTYQTAPGMPFQAWPSGPVTAYAENTLAYPINALRFQRTAGTGRSKYGISQ